MYEMAIGPMKPQAKTPTALVDLQAHPEQSVTTVRPVDSENETAVVTKLFVDDLEICELFYPYLELTYIYSILSPLAY
jgi:hypothetical protein